jgi:hypothetical protein
LIFVRRSIGVESAADALPTSEAYDETMPLQCNLDARGKRFRLLLGVLLAALGIGLGVFWAFPAGGLTAWTITICCLLLGGFAIFEARAGWCALRAMKIKTPV